MADWHKASIVGISPEQQQKLGDGADDGDDELPFRSRRSPVVCRNGCVASSQPLASSIGLDLLRRGANAAEAAVAVAAALAVTEPCSTGLGGDMFCLYYDAASRKVSAVNGSGRSPAGLTCKMLEELYPSDDKGDGTAAAAPAATTIDEPGFEFSPHAVTVPGAARGWEDVVLQYGTGKFSLEALLEPAAQLAEEGFPVAPVTSHMWRAGLFQVTDWLEEDDDEGVPLTIRNTGEGKRKWRGPEAGEVVTNPHMARVLRDLGRDGATRGFYEGQTGRAIADAVQSRGGCLTLDDLRNHTSSEFPNPIASEYRGHRLWQVPPNGQGIAGLIALAGLEHLETHGVIDPPLGPEDLGTDRFYHSLVEMMRLGFADARAHVADAAHMRITPRQLLDPDRIGNRAVQLFDANRATIQGVPDASSCTVSFQVVDRDGNAASFVNSNYMGFGTGIVPRGCGFTLQNRGRGFTLDGGDDHVNCVGPSKRPCHTILPAMLTHADTDELYATLSNMGGNMQPQGHLQLTVDLVACGLDPQAAIDRPRFCIVDGTPAGTVFLEKGIESSAVRRLQQKGHAVAANIAGYGRSIFGRAQIIRRDRTTGVLWAGSDGRCDGCAIGY